MGTSMQRTPNVREQHNGPLSDVANSPIATGGSPKMRDPNYAMPRNDVTEHVLRFVECFPQMTSYSGEDAVGCGVRTFWARVERIDRNNLSWGAGV